MFRLATAPPSPQKATIAFADAKHIVDEFQGRLPATLAGKTDGDLAAIWPAWVASRDAEIRARLHRGDEDSVVHLWLFGTSFTSRPRATDAVLASLGPDAGAALLQGRLEDLSRDARAGRQQPPRRRPRGAGTLGNRRDDAGARLDAARHLEALRERMVRELQQFRRDTASAKGTDDSESSLDAYLTYYRGRGLVSDTSLLATYSIERALADARASRTQATGTIRRVAIVGPGLDFVDKAEGYDFYPLQTLQPFALVDSLVRTGLAHPDGVDVTTFDISPRVVDHLTDARARAERGDPYVVHVALEPDDATHAWHPGVLTYWQRFGDRIGSEVAPSPLPPGMADVRVRAIRVRPELVRSVRSLDLNVILERMPADDEHARFDLIVATNVLVYYEPFEQALALANIGAMLGPDGILLANGLDLPLPLSGLSSPVPVDVVFDQQQGGDTVHWFRRLR